MGLEVYLIRHSRKGSGGVGEKPAGLLENFTRRTPHGGWPLSTRGVARNSKGDGKTTTRTCGQGDR